MTRRPMAAIRCVVRAHPLLVPALLLELTRSPIGMSVLIRRLSSARPASHASGMPSQQVRTT